MQSLTSPSATAGNCPNATVSTITHDIEDRIMVELPKPITQWIRYEAANDLCVKEIYLAWRRGATVDTILSTLRGLQRQDTRKTYGSAHPQASFI